MTEPNAEEKIVEIRLRLLEIYVPAASKNGIESGKVLDFCKEAEKYLTTAAPKRRGRPPKDK